MSDIEKIELANIVLDYIRSRFAVSDIPIMVGGLNRAQGIKGFKVGEIGHPVFEFKDKYIIYLESNDGKTIVTIPYYKETLKPYIDFIIKNK